MGLDVSLPFVFRSRGGFNGVVNTRWSSLPLRGICCCTGFVSTPPGEERSVTEVLVLVTGDEASVPLAPVVVAVVPDEADVERIDAFRLSPLLLGSFSLSTAICFSLASRSAFSCAARSLASRRLFTQPIPVPSSPSSPSPPPELTLPIPHAGAA